MTDRQLEDALRAGLDIIAGAPHDAAWWRPFELALGRFIRRGQAVDADDLRQSFVELLLRRPELRRELDAAPHGTLVVRMKRLFRRHAYETECRSEAGKLRKALDDVLRRGDARFTQRGQWLVSTVRTPPPLPASPFQACGTRLDHGRLADGAVAVLHELGAVRGRTALARALVKAWKLDSPPEGFHEEQSPEERIALKRAVEHTLGRLDSRERTLVADAVRGLPLRSARQRVDLSIAAAHGVRRGAGRKLAEVAAEHGLSADERLYLVEAFVS